MGGGEADVDRVVAGLYRAAGGAEPWTGPLGALAGLLRAWGVQLFGLRLADGGMAFSHDAGGFPPAGMLQYLGHYHQIDPRTPLLAPLDLGQWLHCHEHLDDAFVARHPFYQDFLIPVGGRYASGAKLYQDDELLVILGVSRGRGSSPLDAAEREIVRRVGLHVQTAFGLWRRHSRLQQQAMVGAAILSRLSQPALLVDDQLRIQHCNGPAQALLNLGDTLHNRAGRLACRSASAQARLLLALQGPGLPDKPSVRPAEAAVVRLGGVGSQPGLLVTLTRLDVGATRGAFGPSPLALLLIHDPAQRLTPDALLVATAFALTPAEAQVACAVAAGRSPQQIASNTGVSVHTVRAQLATVFDKVRVGRQAELAAALAALSRW